MQIAAGWRYGKREREREEGINYSNDTEIQRLTHAEHQQIELGRGGGGNVVVVHVRVSRGGEREDRREEGENMGGRWSGLKRSV